MAAGGKMIGEADIEIEEFERPVTFVKYGSIINLMLTMIPVFWYWRKYPKARREVLIVLLIFFIWALLLFDFGFSAMNWLGLEKGIP